MDLSPDGGESNSIESDLRASFEEMTPDGGTEAPPEAPAKEPPTPQQPEKDAPEPAEPDEETEAEARARDEKGRFLKAVETAKEKAADKEKAETLKKGASKGPGSAAGETTPPTTGVAPTPQAKQPEAKPAASAPDAPQAWKPKAWKATAREHWSKLPPDVQQEVERRETEHVALIHEAAEAKKNWGAFREAVGPYEGMIRAEGSDPVQAASRLFQTAAALRTAPPGHKAQMIASIVRDHAIPIELLDQALSGQPMPQQSQQQQYSQPLQPFRDPRLDQLLAQQARNESERQQRELSEFTRQAEFFEDVRADMADLVELHGKRGVALTAQQAYDKAVAMHPEIQKVLQQREAAKHSEHAQASTQRAKAASSSIRSRPAHAPGIHKGNGSVEDDLAAAMEEASGR